MGKSRDQTEFGETILTVYGGGWAGGVSLGEEGSEISDKDLTSFSQAPLNPLLHWLSPWFAIFGLLGPGSKNSAKSP